MTKNTKTLQAAGFDVASLKHGKALDEEKAAVSSAATAAAAFRKGVKGDTLTDAQRKTVDALIAKLTGLRQAGGRRGHRAGDRRRPEGDRRVVDPSPAQLVDLGFFTLRDHSRSAPGGKAQAGAFDIPFIKAMAKHGFNQLSNSSTPVDSMHFELRRRGTKKK